MENIESKYANTFRWERYYSESKKKTVGNLYKIRIASVQLSGGLSKGKQGKVLISREKAARGQLISKLRFLVEKTNEIVTTIRWQGGTRDLFEMDHSVLLILYRRDNVRRCVASRICWHLHYTFIRRLNFSGCHRGHSH